MRIVLFLFDLVVVFYCYFSLGLFVSTATQKLFKYEMR